MIFDILTIFPDLLVSPLEEGIIRRAKERQQIRINCVNLRDYAHDRHSTTDDRPFGGGEGMVMKADVLAEAVKSLSDEKTQTTPEKKRIILLTPQGRQYNQDVAQELSQCQRLSFICGRYEGVDERFIRHYVDDEISIGDFILTGGELAAMVIIDSVTRLLPDVLGSAESVSKDTFSRKLLKHSQYTRPRVFEGEDVPSELLSGNHEKIAEYRFVESVRRTLTRRPDLLSHESFTGQEIKVLKRHGLVEAVKLSRKISENDFQRKSRTNRGSADAE